MEGPGACILEVMPSDHASRSCLVNNMSHRAMLKYAVEKGGFSSGIVLSAGDMPPVLQMTVPTSFRDAPESEM